MARWTLAGVGLAALIGFAQLDLRAEPRPAAQHEAGAAAETGAAEARALLNRYCVACHNRRTLTAGLALDTLDVAQVETNAATWEHVIRRLRANAMPPRRPAAPHGRGTPATSSTGSRAELDRTGLENPDPGRPAVHRLNRVEYANAIRDIFGLEIDPNALLPADDEQEGFDNIAEVLSVSPTLIERYLAAARRISQLVVGDTSVRAVAEVYPIHGAVDPGRPRQRRPAVRVARGRRHRAPLPGRRRVHHPPQPAESRKYGYVRGLGRAHQLDVRVDGERVGGFTVGRGLGGGPAPADGLTPASSRASTTRAPSPNGSCTRCTPTRGSMSAHPSPRAGTRSASLPLHRRPALAEGISAAAARPLETYSYGQNEFQEGNPGVSEVQIIGPYNPSGAAGLSSRDRLFVCEAGRRRGRRGALRGHDPLEPGAAGLSPSGHRGGRRDRCCPSTATAAPRSGFDAGIQAAVERILVDPEFLFRIETDPSDVAPGTPYAIGDLELASRLSFFLWSSIPDNELLEVAAAGRLREAGGARRAESSGCWPIPARRRWSRTSPASGCSSASCATRRPTPRPTPRSTRTCARRCGRRRRSSWRTSCGKTVRSSTPCGRTTRSSTKRLARHYGIPDVHGLHFRRVEYPDDTRGGILGHASLLTITSYANRTSPVVRGVWLLENILGTPPSPAPARRAGAAERHRGQHAPVDPRAARAAPLQRGLRELPQHHRSARFRARGVRRRSAAGAPRTGAAPRSTRASPSMRRARSSTGTELHGLAGLRNVIIEREDQFVETVTEKLADVRAGPHPRAPRHAGGPSDQPPDGTPAS